MLDLQIAPPQSQPSRSDLIAAFKRVIKRAGRPQATDLHVRRLLNYVQANDHDGQGIQRSLEQLAKILFLNVSTCRRVIRRATKKFGLLTVTEQRHTPGGQVANRYSINWKQVDALLCDAHHENTPVTRNKFQRSSGSPESRATLISRRALAAVSTERTGLNPSLASYNNFARQARTRTQNKRIHPSHLESRATHISRMPVRLAPDLCPGASSCCWPKHMQLTSSNSSDASVPIEQPDNTTARAARSPRISNFDFSPPNSTPDDLSDHASKNNITKPMPVRFGPSTSNLARISIFNITPDALSDQAPDLKSRARSKRILHSSEGTRFPSPMRHVVHESQCSTTPRSTSYPGALSDHASKNNIPEPMPVRLHPRKHRRPDRFFGPLFVHALTSDQPPATSDQPLLRPSATSAVNPLSSSELESKLKVPSLPSTSWLSKRPSSPPGRSHHLALLFRAFRDFRG